MNDRGGKPLRGHGIWRVILVSGKQGEGRSTKRKWRSHGRRKDDLGANEGMLERSCSRALKKISGSEGEPTVKEIGRGKLAERKIWCKGLWGGGIWMQDGYRPEYIPT